MNRLSTMNRLSAINQLQSINQLPAMNRLQKIQAALLHDIYHGDTSSAPYLDTGKFGSLERLDIYTNNLRLGLCESLRNAYPVVEQLVGAEFFEHLSRGYLSAYPLHQGNRNQFGHAFATFLSKQAALEEMPYVTEIAAIEWAYFQASIANQAQVLDFEQLQQEVSNPNYVLTPHPSAHWVYNAYNSVELWQQHQQGATDELALKESDQHWLIWRDPSHEILLQPVPKALIDMLEKSQQGLPFDEIMASLQPNTDISELQHSFSDAIYHGVFALLR